MVEEFTCTLPLVSNGRVTIPDPILRNIGATDGDLLEIKVKLASKKKV